MSFVKSIVLILLLSSSILPQQSSLSKGVNYLSAFIASDYFSDLAHTNNDLSLTDTLFERAVSFYNYNYSDALLGLMLAVVPYKEIPVKLPLISTPIYYPLTSAEDSIFGLKNKNLPKYLLFDSPQNDYGDKDKLAHFFGSAFLSYSTLVFDLGNFIGYFVEVFEETFKVQSSIDERDLFVNDLGKYFGEALKEDHSLLPSRMFILATLIHFHYTL